MYDNSVQYDQENPLLIPRIPMDPRRFELWVRDDFMDAVLKNYPERRASGIMGEKYVSLTITRADAQDPRSDFILAYSPRTLKKGKSFKLVPMTDEELQETTLVTRKKTPAEVIAVLSDLFIRGLAPAGEGWRHADAAYFAAEEKAIAAASELMTAEAMALPEDLPERALKALLDQDPAALESVFYAGFKPNARITENVEKNPRRVPVLARYFAEAEDLSFALDAVKAFTAHGLCLRFTQLSASSTLEALVDNHSDDPQLLPVWKALVDTDLTFARDEETQNDWMQGVNDVVMGYEADSQFGSDFQGNPAVYQILDIAERETEGLPFEGIGPLSLVAGRRLTRVLLAPRKIAPVPKLSPAKDLHSNSVLSLDGCVLLDFEGVFAVMKNGRSAFTDSHALDVYPEGRDVSEKFSEAIGKRAQSVRVTLEDEFYKKYSSYGHAIHTIEFEDGTRLAVGDTSEDVYLRCFKCDWGEFRVAEDGTLEHAPGPNLSLFEAYCFEPMLDEDWELADLAVKNPAVTPYLDRAWEEWWRSNRKKKPFRTWYDVIKGDTDRKAQDAVGKILKHKFKEPIPLEGPGRDALPPAYSTDRGIAVGVLEDLPPSFAEALGIVRPKIEDDSLYSELYKQGVKLTKTVDEANAVAKAHGWLISFKKA